MNSVAPPKPKRKSSNPDGTITIFYNNEVNFPADFIDQVKAQRKMRQLGVTPQSPFIDISPVAGPDSQPDLVGI